jgi:hypothetical protein
MTPRPTQASTQRTTTRKPSARNRSLFSPGLATLALATALAAQAEDPTARPAGPPPPEAYTPPSQKIEWPRDRDRPICVVGGQRYTVLDLLTYLDERHAPLTLELIETPTGRALLESPTFARMVRQYADVLALRAEAESLEIPQEEIDAAISASLKRGFEKHLSQYTANREKAGQPVELTQKRINILLEHYQNREGLATELQGWLDALAPETPLEADGLLRDYYQDRTAYLGGRVTLSHILVRHRDARTGELLVGEDRKEVATRLADIQQRLAEDGSNFEEVARVMSDDRSTAERGGILPEVARFDERLPAALCRTAWQLEDGEFTRVPVESPYGLHFVKRLRYNNHYYVYFHPDLKPEIQELKRAEEQEDLLWRVRAEHRVRLLY